MVFNWIKKLKIWGDDEQYCADVISDEAGTKRLAVIPSAQVEVSELFIEKAKNGSSSDMTVDGSTTPVTFTIDADADHDTFVNEIRLYGQGSGIKFGQFLSIASSLTNGIEIKIKSDDIVLTLPLIKNTEDIKHLLSIPISNFQLDIQSGRDDVAGAWSLANPFPIRKQGAHGAGNDDYIQVKVQDNLTSLLELEFLASGYQKDVS